MTTPVMLREVRDDDLDALYENQADPESGAMAGVPGRDRQGFDAHQARVSANPDTVQRVIVLEGGEVVGDIVSWCDELGDREVGYRIARRHWGRGIASAALPLFLAELTDRPLYAHVLKPNTRSLRVLEKCGFVALPPDDEHNDDPETVGFVLR